MNTTVRVQNRNHLTIALAAGAVFAPGLGLRQTQPLFISPLNSHTGIGYATISLAFGVAQPIWGVAQPVAGAVADRWGPRQLLGTRYLATLFGMVMLSRQIGGFLGAWLGGKAFDATHNYDWMWLVDITLCLLAAFVPIRRAQ